MKTLISIPVRKVKKLLKRIPARSIEQPLVSEEVPGKYWTYELGRVIINVEKLYVYLFKNGYRYYRCTDEIHLFLVKRQDNSLEFLYFYNKIWKLCQDIIDKDFNSVSEEERTKVKDALKTSKKSLKKRRLVQLTTEELLKMQDSESKRFLLSAGKKSKYRGGNAHGTY